jgi:hypothetical protein
MDEDEVDFWIWWIMEQVESQCTFNILHIDREVTFVAVIVFG